MKKVDRNPPSPSVKGPPVGGWASRAFLVAVGSISLALGFVGIFVPLLPTTPFILLAAACFARSSPRFHDWLHGHRVFGPMIRDWKARGAISIRAKALATLSITASLAIVWSRTSSPIGRAGATTVLVAILIFLLSRPRV